MTALRARIIRDPSLRRSLVIVLFLLHPLPLPAAENLYNFTSLTVQRGQDYVLGDNAREITTLEHYGLWDWGDIFAFYDHSRFLNDNNVGYYTEINPRLRLLSLDQSTTNTQWRPSDIFIAGALEQGSGGYQARMLGMGLNWRVPHVSNLQTNFYWRDDRQQAGSTWQLTTVWVAPFSLGGLTGVFDGFADLRAPEGTASNDLLINPQLKIDMGEPFGLPDTLYFGVEYVWWRNKFGIKGVNESVLSPLIQWRFSL